MLCNVMPQFYAAHAMLCNVMPQFYAYAAHAASMGGFEPLGAHQGGAGCWVVLDGAGQREKTKGRRPWMGWGTVQPIQGRLSHLRGPQGPSGCPTCVGPQAAGDYWRGEGHTVEFVRLEVRADFSLKGMAQVVTTSDPQGCLV